MASLPIDTPQDTGSGPRAQVPRHRDVRVALWPVMIVLYAAILPREIRLLVGSFEFFADRIALLIVLPYIIRKIMQGAIRFVLPDFLVVIAGLWMIIAMVTHYGIGGGLERGGSAAFDATIGYFLARISFRSLVDMRRALVLLLPGVVAVGLSIMIESITRTHIVKPLAEAIFGKLPYYVAGDIEGYRNTIEFYRLGLLRARGPFEHSIHAGLFLASLVGIYNLAGLRGYVRFFANLVAPLAFFTVSSAALLGLILGYGLIIYEIVQRRSRELSWRLLATVAVIGLVFLQIVSNSGPVGLITRFLTFDAQTAFYRQLIWDYGLDSVAMNPWFGIGYSDYERPEWMVSNSVDAHWLVLAVRFGFIPSLCMLGAVAAALITLGRASVSVPRTDQLFYRGIAISLFVMGVAMFTVFLWGGINMWFTVLLGACVTCAQRSYKSIKVEIT